MSDDSRVKIFVSYSYADADAARVRDRLRNTFNVSTTESATGATTRHSSLIRAITASDLAVIFMPAPEDPASRNVLVEAGAALALGLPIIVVGDDSTIPADLADVTSTSWDTPDRLVEKVKRLAARGRTPAEPALSTTGSPKPSLAALQVARKRLNEPGLQGADAVRAFDELFKATGATTLVSTAPFDVAAPDLAIWHDELTATLGTPLPVEILARGGSWPAIRRRLERTLAASGGRTLLALSLDNVGNGPRLWSDSRDRILLASASELLDALSEEPLPAALARLVEQAMP